LALADVLEAMLILKTKGKEMRDFIAKKSKVKTLLKKYNKGRTIAIFHHFYKQYHPRKA
jgi:hypothetical protein